jgi:hypothetical protein
MTVIINSAHLLEIYLCNQCLIVFFPNWIFEFSVWNTP